MKETLKAQGFDIYLKFFNLSREKGSSPFFLSALKALWMISHFLFLLATSLTSFFSSCGSFPMYCKIISDCSEYRYMEIEFKFEF